MRRVVLAFDTATEALAIGVGVRDERGTLDVVASESLPAPRAAMTRLLPEVESVLRSVGLSRREIELVVCGRGPGSFTGVRIGVATAKGLAHGLGVGVDGVGTLDAIAWAFADHAGLVAVVGDAMRGEVYPALFETGDGRVSRLTPDRVMSPRDAAVEIADRGEPIVLTGNGVRKHRGVFTDVLGDRCMLAEDRSDPTGGGLLDAWLHSEPDRPAHAGDPGSLLPVYTRLSDAEEAERTTGSALPDTGVAGPGEADRP